MNSSGMKPADIFRIRSITDFAVAPQSGQVVAVLSWLDEASDSELSSLALVAAHGLSLLIPGQMRADSPQFSPDGRYLGFLARGQGHGARNVWVLDFHDLSRPPIQISFSSEPASEFAWSPDSVQIAYCAKTPRPPQRSSAVVCTTMRYKSYVEGWIDQRRKQVWVKALYGADARQVTADDAEYSDIAFASDGAAILCRSVGLRDDGRFGMYKIRQVALTDGAIHEFGPSSGVAFAPSLSPDGKWLAYIGSAGESADGSLNRRVFVGSATDEISTFRDVLEDWDFTAINSLLNETRPHTTIEAPVWSGDGQTLYFTATVHGGVNVYSAPRTGGVPTPVTSGEHEVVRFERMLDGSVIALMTTPTEPGDLWHLTGASARRLTAINAGTLSALTLQSPEPVRFRSPGDGVEIIGWVVKPADFDISRKYPLVTRIAGGPYLTYGHSFVDEVHTLASAGFVVFYCNPHGSQSFGQSFSSSVVGDWFGKDVADILAGVEHMVSLGYVDPERLGLVGASYGGTLINWIVAHDHRFAAAVSQRALGNLHSGFATSEWGWTNSMAFQFGGINAFDDPMHYLTRSPVWYVNDIETPILFLQAGQDTLTPVEQVEQLYVGLKLRNKPTELVVYPEEQHYVRRYGKPSNRVDYSERVIGWLHAHMSGNA